MAKFWNWIAARRDVRVCAEVNGKRHAGIYLCRWCVAAICILILALCAMGLTGCAEDTEPLAEDGGAASDSANDEYVLASSYDEIYQAVCSSLDEDADLDSVNTETSAAQLALVRAYDEISDESSEADNEPDDEDMAAELISSSWDLSDLATPQNALLELGSDSLVTAQDESGHIYVVSDSTLSILQAAGDSTERVAQLSISDYDELQRWESTSAAYVEGDTLAVVGSLAEDTDWNPDAPDYALSAYASPRVMIAFFDISDPSNPSYLTAVGVTGTLLGFEESDGILTVVTARSAVPAVSSDVGAWLVTKDEEEDDDEESTSYPTSQEVKNRLELRENDVYSYVPAVYQDGTLTAVAADRVYLPADGSGAVATAVATFDLEEQTADSAFAVYSDELEMPTVSMGDGVAYLQWENAQFDEESAQISSSTLIMSVPLQGSSLSGVAAIGRLEGSAAGIDDVDETDDSDSTSGASGTNGTNGTSGTPSSLSYIYDGTLYRLVRSDLEVGDQAVSGSWMIQALDEELNVLGEVEVTSSGEPLGSILFSQGRAYLVSGKEQYTLSVADLSDPTNMSLSDEGDASEWPEVFLQLDDGTLLGYGNQTSRAGCDEAWALLVGGTSADVRAKDTDVLRLVTLSSDGVSLGDTVTVDSSEDYLAKTAHTVPLQSIDVADDLVGMVINEGTDAAAYRFYRFSDDSLEAVGEISLADDADTESDSDADSDGEAESDNDADSDEETESDESTESDVTQEDAEATGDEDASDMTEYRGARLVILDGYAYVMSFEADSATLYVCDASTLEVCDEISLEDEVQLSEE